MTTAVRVAPADQSARRATPALQREVFSTSRLLEFFTEKELRMQIGHAPERWPLALVKELVDNALDACERAGVAPTISVAVDEDGLTVQDNGPGLDPEVLRGSLDYTQRVSTNTYYVSPTRGQLGNALKTVWAAAFVATGGQYGRVEVAARGQRHTVEVTLDRIAQEPRLDLTSEPDASVQNGTLVHLCWPGIASCLAPGDTPDSYKTAGLGDVGSMVRAYALFNPHATFSLTAVGPAGAVTYLRLQATDPGWKKWSPAAPTSPHWYTEDQFRGQVAAYLTKDRQTGRVRMVREVVAEFAGLSGTAKQKAIAEATGLGRARLDELVTDDGRDVAGEKVAALLAAMRAQSRPVKPEALGVLGEAHLTGHLASLYAVERESVQYRKALAVAPDGRPFVLETAFGVRVEAEEDWGREIVAGVNWSPALELPFDKLPFLAGQQRADDHDPVVLVAHLAKPDVQFTDRGKGRADV